MFWKRRKGEDGKVPLDGDQLARLINMNVARREADELRDLQCDFLSAIRSVRGYLLREDRDSRRRALNHWFWRVDHYKQGNSSAIAFADSELHAECLRNYALRLTMNRYEDEEHSQYRLGMFVSSGNANNMPAITCDNYGVPAITCDNYSVPAITCDNYSVPAICCDADDPVPVKPEEEQRCA